MTVHPLLSGFAWLLTASAAPAAPPKAAPAKAAAAPAAAPAADGEHKETIGQEVDVGGNKGQPAAAGTALRVGVVAVQGAKDAKANGEKLSKYLAKAVGKKADPVVFTDYDSLANAVVDEKVDVAWMPPLQAFNAKLGGATLVAKLLRNGQPNYRSVIFARADSPFTDLASVKDAKVGWVERNSSTGYLFPLATIVGQKLKMEQLFKEQKFMGDHAAVCKAVDAKQVDVGATLADEPPKGKDLKAIEVTGCKSTLGPKAKLKVLAVSEPVPNDVFAVRKDLDAATADKLKKAVLDLPKGAEGKALLKGVLKADGMAEVQEGDFDPMAHALEAASTIPPPK